MGLITNPEKFEEKLRQAKIQETTILFPRQKELEHVTALLQETEKEAEEVARTLPKAKGIIAEKLKQQADEVDRRYRAFTTRISELEESLSYQLTDQNIDDLLQFRETVALGLGNPSPDDKRKWLEILQASVTVTNGNVVVTCRLGGKPLQFRVTEVNKS